MHTRLFLLLLFLCPFFLQNELVAQNAIPLNPNFSRNLIISSVMTADQVIPTIQNDIMAIAGLIVDADRETLGVNIYANNASGNFIQVTIRKGDPDNVGPILLDLSDEIEGKRIHTTLTDISELVISDLLAGNCYMEIRTFNFPGVAIRGQLELEKDDSYIGLANASNILNGGSDSPARGVITAHHTPELYNLEINFFASELSSPITSAYLQIGNETTATESTAFDLTSFVTDNRIYANINPAQFLSNLTNDNIFLKIHTEDYPDGEIRAQVDYTENIIHDGWISGQQVAPTATDAGISGFTLFSLKPDFESVNFWIFTDNLDEEAISVTLHDAPLGSTSGIIYNYSNQFDGKVLTGTITDNMWYFANLLFRGTIYTTIGTPNYPAGLIRGQVYRVARDGYIYNFCPNTISGADGGGIIATNRKLNYSHLLATAHNMDNDIVSVTLNEGGVNTPGPTIYDIDFSEENYLVNTFWSSNSITQPFNTTIAADIRMQNTYLQFATEDYPDGEVRGQNTNELNCPESTEPPNNDNNNDADLELSLAVNQSHYVQYDSLLFCFTATNNGTLPANNVSVDVPLLDEFAFCYSFTTLGEYDLFNQTWNIGTLAPGETVKLSFNVLAMIGGTNIDYFAQINTSSAIDHDSSPGNDQDQIADEDDEVSTTFIALANGGSGNGNMMVDLELAVAVDQLTAGIYENVNYNITVVNNGTNQANNIAIAIEIPDGLSHTSHSATKGQVQLWNNYWHIAQLAPGESATLNLELFTMQPSGVVRFFTQIHAVTEPDTDSTPGNATSSIVTEDDEALVDFAIQAIIINGNPTNALPGLAKESIYPNPTDNTINVTIESKIEIDSEIEIYNLLGQLVITESKSFNKGFNELQYDLTNLPSGTYFIKIENLAINSKFVKN